jgi:4-amino-4-deoxy-L-arabinose transferase-like glycosyltransferase
MAAGQTGMPLTRAASQAHVALSARTSDWAIAVLLGALTIAVLAWTAPQIGLTWDEPVYTAAQRSYVTWFEQLAAAPRAALSQGGIRAGWDINHEHPPLAKLWSGVLWRLSGDLFGPLVAYRLGTITLVGALVAMIYLTVAGSYGLGAGLASVATLVAMPRFFFHAHLAALDVPAAVSYVAIITLFWRTRNARGARASTAVGLLLALAWGAALATKINAAFALPVLALWALLVDRRWDHVLRLGLMSAIGPLVFVALWPWLYHDTLIRLAKYILFITVDHWQIAQWYLGQRYMPPPWHFAFVMFVMVVPLTTLIAMLAGALRAWRDPRPGQPIVLWSLAAAMPLVALTTGKSMVYDNERLFMAAFPYAAMLAGCGLAWVIAGLYRTLRRRVAALAAPAAALLALGAFAPQLVSAAALYPHLLSYYSETVGGLAGAQRLGMESTYWCDTYVEGLEYINSYARPGAVVWAEEWSHDVLIWYQQAGLLRPDLRIAVAPGATSQLPGGNRSVVEADIWEADYVLLQQRQSGFQPVWERFSAERTPVLTVARQGVTLLQLYERR